MKLFGILEKTHPQTSQDFEVEYATQGTSTSINHAATQTEESSQEVMINTAEPPVELTTSEEPLKTPEPPLDQILTELCTTTPQIDCSETVVYDEFLAELNCIDF